jgi:hypothetical protein
VLAIGLARANPYETRRDGAGNGWAGLSGTIQPFRVCGLPFL